VVSIPRLVVAAPASGHGKTTVATGLIAAYAARGAGVAPFKVGPDYIDPGYHGLAAGRPGRNLDPVMVGEDLIGPLFAHGAEGADLAVVEGVMGLYDGRVGEGDFGSTAHVAALLRAPVLLVVDAAAQGRSVAALVHGFRSFAAAPYAAVRLGGVILNRVGSDRHEALLREACEEVGAPVLGTLRRDPALAVPSRHLGLVPAAERRAEAAALIEALAGIAAAGLDLDAIWAVARSAPELPVTPWRPGDAIAEARPAAADRGDSVAATAPVVAVAGGPAFSFSYAETTELLAAAGARVHPVDPLRDEALPPGTRGLVVGGGFPEAYAADLAGNAPLRSAVAALAATGAPIAAECAGLLWLCRSLDGAPMCGVLDAEASMTGRLALGYRDAVALVDSHVAPAGARVTGHEFHRTSVTPRSGLLADRRAEAAWAWRGADPEGFVDGGVHASYLHLHWAGRPDIPRRLVAACA
jgi:cobyrinic acid a,c-diamide synthase